MIPKTISFLIKLPLHIFTDNNTITSTHIEGNISIICKVLIRYIKLLYLNHLCLFCYSKLMKILRYLCLGLIFSMRLDSRKEIQSVRSACSVLHSKGKAHILLSLWSKWFQKWFLCLAKLPLHIFNNNNTNSYMQSFYRIS